MSDNVLSFKETEIAKSVRVHANLNRRLGTRRYDIGFPNVLITVFLFPVAISFLSHRREGIPLAERSYHRRKLRATNGWRRPGKGLEAPSGG